MSQRQYNLHLKPLLSPEAFRPDQRKLLILIANLAVLVIGWAIAASLEHPYSLLFLPMTIVMGVSISTLIAGCHDLIHGSIVRNIYLIQTVGLLAMAMAWMPPTLWREVHNRIHHKTTNSLFDPDRSFLYEQSNNWSKWVQHQLVPSCEVHPIGLVLGIIFAWLVYTFRVLSFAILFNNTSPSYLPASFTVSPKARLAIAKEFLLILFIHFGILTYLKFDLIKIVLSYLLPCFIGYSFWMFYVFTNHFVSPLTNINDPLVNSLSIRVPKILDRLHFHSSHHVEHHLFPSMNTNYYPEVQALLNKHYPDFYRCVDAAEAWKGLLSTPRHYKDAVTLTNWSGTQAISCPFTPEIKAEIGIATGYM